MQPVPGCAARRIPGLPRGVLCRGREAEVSRMCRAMDRETLRNAG